MRIVFMGTPEFAVRSLDILVKHKYDIAAVITAPDRKAGRGQKIQQSDVKAYCLEHQLPILQPTNLKRESFLQELADLKADLQVVVAFRMLPEVVWSMPPMGTINLHASLLPQYRGAAPINWAIMNGETESGVTTFFIDSKIDTGDLIMQKCVSIGADDTAGELHDKLMEVGARLVLDTVRAIESGTVSLISQKSADHLIPAPKIFKEDCLINWSDSTINIFNKIRGLSPYPAAFTYLDGKMLKIYRATYQLTSHDQPAGTLVTDHKSKLIIFTADGKIKLQEVQLEGKKRMDIDDFLRGYDPMAITDGSTS